MVRTITRIHPTVSQLHSRPDATLAHPTLHSAQPLNVTSSNVCSRLRSGSDPSEQLLGFPSRNAVAWVGFEEISISGEEIQWLTIWSIHHKPD